MDENEKAQIWKDYSLEHWNDWKWQIKNRITDTEQLSKIVHLKKEEKEDIEKCLQKFKMAITPYYAALIDDSNPDCPIRKQAIPSAKELIIDPCEREDPLCEEKYSPVPGLVHRYPDRVLLVLTHKCSMYCRHCTRRRLVGCEDYSISDKRLEAALEYIRKNTVIRDVLLSGGDPLVMPDARLEGIIKKVREIPHVEIIRIGTRTPVVLPMRITDELLNMLKKYHPLWINTHFNHPLSIYKRTIPSSLFPLKKRMLFRAI
jgi:lysine 2,3-aminomutase